MLRWAASAAAHPGFMAATWTTRTLSPALRCSSRCTRRVRCSQSALLVGGQLSDELADPAPALFVARAEQDHRPVACRHHPVRAEQVEYVIAVAPDGRTRPAPAHDDVEANRQLHRDVAVLGGAGDL